MGKVCRLEINGNAISARRGDLLLDAALLNGMEFLTTAGPDFAELVWSVCSKAASSADRQMQRQFMHASRVSCRTFVSLSKMCVRP